MSDIAVDVSQLASFIKTLYGVLSNDANDQRTSRVKLADIDKLSLSELEEVSHNIPLEYLAVLFLQNRQIMKWQPSPKDGVLSIAQKKEVVLQELRKQIGRRQTDMLTEIGKLKAGQSS